MTKEELNSKLFDWCRQFSPEDFSRYFELLEESDIKVGMIVEWASNGENETMLPFYENNHWQTDHHDINSVKGVKAQVIHVTLTKSKHALCYVLQDEEGKRYYVRKDGIKLSEFSKQIWEINKELNEI